MPSQGHLHEQNPLPFRSRRNLYLLISLRCPAPLWCDRTWVEHREAFVLSMKKSQIRTGLYYSQIRLASVIVTHRPFP